MKKIVLSLPDNQAEKIRLLVKRGHFATQQEALRAAIRLFLSEKEDLLKEEIQVKTV